jgi:hypothetical protein
VKEDNHPAAIEHLMVHVSVISIADSVVVSKMLFENMDVLVVMVDRKTTLKQYFPLSCLTLNFL